MSFKFIQKIPTETEIKELVPFSDNLKKIKLERDEEIKNIILGKSHKFLVIIGPCSANEESPVYDYVCRLAKVQEKVKDKLFLVPRIYTNKPRTNGEGYKGMLHQPNPEKAPNMLDGIKAIRRMHVKTVAESGLTSADEMLYPENTKYLMDILSYIAIGARSVENQQHRLTSSGITVPIGMKNPTSGDLTVMMNSINAAQASHDFIFDGYETKTTGNPLAHAILRGYVNKHGQNIPNYHYEDLMLAAEFYENHNLENPVIIVDTNHSNSGKRFFEQPRIAKEILYSRKYNPDLKKMVKGLMIESYIEEGCQKTTEHVYGKSITDPCLGWKDSEELLLYIADNV